MSKPIIHARSSARRYGGQPEDYLEIHDFMDSSKAAFPDNRHRALTHNSWFLFILERVFGHEIPVHDEDGNFIKNVSVRDVGEQHILEDFGGKYIPTVADYLEGMEFQEWMNNGRKGYPSSHRKIAEKQKNARDISDSDEIPEEIADGIPMPEDDPWPDLSPRVYDGGPNAPWNRRNRRHFTLD